VKINMCGKAQYVEKKLLNMLIEEGRRKWKKYIPMDLKKAIRECIVDRVNTFYVKMKILEGM
jgi:hypothetical protein